MFGLFTKIHLFFKDLWHGKPVIAERGGLRSSRWPTIRKHHLAEEPVCQWCGGTEHLEVHHISAFHLHPELELSMQNLITLCECPGKDCHLVHGHFGNFRTGINPNIRKDCAERKANGFK